MKCKAQYARRPVRQSLVRPARCPSLGQRSRTHYARQWHSFKPLHSHLLRVWIIARISGIREPVGDSASYEFLEQSVLTVENDAFGRLVCLRAARVRDDLIELGNLAGIVGTVNGGVEQQFEHVIHSALDGTGGQSCDGEVGDGDCIVVCLLGYPSLFAGTTALVAQRCLSAVENGDEVHDLGVGEDCYRRSVRKLCANKASGENGIHGEDGYSSPGFGKTSVEAF